jgi:hypothetical protein
MEIKNFLKKIKNKKIKPSSSWSAIRQENKLYLPGLVNNKFEDFEIWNQLGTSEFCLIFAKGIFKLGYISNFFKYLLRK